MKIGRNFACSEFGVFQQNRVESGSIELAALRPLKTAIRRKLPSERPEFGILRHTQRLMCV
jgi:hypothetical protein